MTEPASPEAAADPGRVIRKHEGTKPREATPLPCPAQRRRTAGLGELKAFQPLLLAIGLWLAWVPRAPGLSLAWDADPDPSIAGYRLYYGEASGVYSSRIDVGPATIASVSGLSAGVSYYFAVTAYDTNGLESGFSSEIRYTVPTAGSPPPAMPAAGFITGENLGTIRNGYSGFAGMQLLVGGAPITVTALGRMTAPGNSATHLVKLVNASDGTDVPGAAVTIDMSAGTSGQFQYADLAGAVVLAAGTAYYLVSQEAAGGDVWYYDDTTVNTTSMGNETSAVWGDGSGLWHLNGGAGQSYGPVDFKYVVSVPTTPPSPQPYLTGSNPGTLQNGFSGFAGMQILVGAAPITVTTLGRMTASGNSSTHVVKLVNASDGTDVPGGAVSIDMSTGTAGQFQYAELSSPVVLSPGTAYYVVTEELAGGDGWYYDDTTIETTSAATAISAAWGTGPGQWHLNGGAGQTYGPVDFKYTQ